MVASIKACSEATRSTHSASEGLVVGGFRQLRRMRSWRSLLLRVGSDDAARTSVLVLNLFLEGLFLLFLLLFSLFTSGFSVIIRCRRLAKLDLVMWPLTRFAASGDRPGALVVFRNTKSSIFFLVIPIIENQF